MRRLWVVLAGSALLALVPSSGLADGTTLVGTVGPGFSISLTDTSGTAVKRLDPGAYTVQVHDESEAHDFHLLGPGVDQATVVETEGDFNWPVTLSVGTYRFFCDVHPALSGSFTVGQLPPPAPARLVGKVGPGATISLRHADGSRVRGLVPATYLITVRDLSARDNFHLSGPGVNRKTGVAQKGKVTWKLALRTGAFRYRSDAHSKLKGSFAVLPPSG